MQRNGHFDHYSSLKVLIALSPTKFKCATPIVGAPRFKTSDRTRPA